MVDLSPIAHIIFGLVLSSILFLHPLVPPSLSFWKDLRLISVRHLCTFIVYISLYSYSCQIMTQPFSSHSLYFILWSRHEDKNYMWSGASAGKLLMVNYQCYNVTTTFLFFRARRCLSAFERVLLCSTVYISVSNIPVNDDHL